mgnify:CR=1 FL=1
MGIRLQWCWVLQQERFQLDVVRSKRVDKTGKTWGETEMTKHPPSDSWEHGAPLYPIPRLIALEMLVSPGVGIRIHNNFEAIQNTSPPPTCIKHSVLKITCCGNTHFHDQSFQV